MPPSTKCEDTVGSHSVGYPCRVCLFAGYPLNTDSTGGDHCITYRYVRFHGDSRIHINLITLFALVLVIGTVVDDAIVVVEAVQARFDVGYKSSYMASVDA